MNLSQREKEDLDLINFMNIDNRLKAEESLSTYIKQSWEIIEPGIQYIHNWHIDAIAEYLEAVNLGQITRLLINMPPRYMKSISVTVDFPTWVWIRNPYKRFISLSYSATLSKKHNINRRDIIQSPWYQGNWSDRFTLKADKNTQMEFENDKLGFMFATSIGSTLTGLGSDVIIVDDPHNPTQAQSDTERESAIEFFKTTLPTRLNDKKKGAIIVVMQRLHEEDISGYCLQQGGYTHLCLPGIAEKRQVITFPITLRTIERNEGDLLWPQREGQKEIDEMKKALGSYGFSGQYQQTPSPSEGGMLKRGWWQYYTSPIADESFDELIQSWDLTFKESDGTDFVVGQIWGRIRNKKYLVDQVRDRMDFTTTLNAIRSMSAKHPLAMLKLIEEKANGAAVISVLRHELGGIIPIIPKESKMARTSAISPDIEAENVYLPSFMPFTNDFVDECAMFPNGSHDDMVDAMSQAMYRILYHSSPPKGLPKFLDNLPSDVRDDLVADRSALESYMKENNLTWDD